MIYEVHLWSKKGRENPPTPRSIYLSQGPQNKSGEHWFAKAHLKLGRNKDSTNVCLSLLPCLVHCLIAIFRLVLHAFPYCPKNETLAIFSGSNHGRLGLQVFAPHHSYLPNTESRFLFYPYIAHREVAVAIKWQINYMLLASTCQLLMNSKQCRLLSGIMSRWFPLFTSYWAV